MSRWLFQTCLYIFYIIFTPKIGEMIQFDLHPRKIDMEPEKDDLEGDFPFQLGDFLLLS